MIKWLQRKCSPGKHKTRLLFTQTKLPIGKRSYPGVWKVYSCKRCGLLSMVHLPAEKAEYDNYIF